jgi:hypothetical protein
MRTPENRRPRSVALLLLLVPLILALAGPPSASQAASPLLTNGCLVSPRGIPTCGAYVGATYGSNSDVTAWESEMGKRLGVHRTFWGPSGVAKAVATAKADVAHHRIPWISFKAPYSWELMAVGAGDQWARDIATRLSSIGGPVWVAVHHEPENDGGNIQAWKAMQEHLAPIMRAAAPNLGYSVILMGYHQFYGDPKHSLSAMWPNTKIDLAGFDIYEEYGVQGRYKWKDIDAYFAKMQQWSATSGVPWGLAETGYSDPAALQKPNWPSLTYDNMVSHGGIAFTYFNTTLNSKANWALSTTAKKNAFTTVNRTAPTMQ